MPSPTSAAADPFAHLFQALPVPVLLAGAHDGVLRWTNPAAARQLGYLDSELSGLSLTALLGPEDRAACEPLWAEGTDALAQRIRWRIRARDGPPVVAHLGPLADYQGERVRILWFVPAPDEALPGATMPPMELADFAFSAFHDLKEPIHIIEGYARLMDAREGLDPELREHVATIRASADRLQAFVLDVLEYFRARAQGSQREPLPFGDAVDEAVAALALRIKEARAVVQRGELPTLPADRPQVRRLLQNLLTNALKFHGPDPPRILVEALPAGTDWEFTVQDNGIGIPEPQREWVFQPFHRLHSVDAYPGSGIGLSTCKAIVEAHGGHIWITPNSPKGTVVHFTLPKGA